MKMEIDEKKETVNRGKDNKEKEAEPVGMGYDRFLVSVAKEGGQVVYCVQG